MGAPGLGALTATAPPNKNIPRRENSFMIAR